MELSWIANLYQRVTHNKTLVNGSLFSLFSFFGQGMSFVLLIILANYILPEEYGLLSLFNTVVLLLGFLVAFSSKGYASISFFKKELEDYKKDFTATILLGVFSILLLAIPVICFGSWLGEKLQLSEQLLWYLLAIAFFTFTFQFQQDYLRIKEKIISFGIYNCGFSLLNFVLSLYLVINLKQSWMGRINAQLICTLGVGVLSILFFVKNDLFRFDFSKQRYRDILSWSIPMIPHAATDWIKQGLDRYIINYFYTTYDVGIFSFALNLSNVVIIIGTAFNSTNSVTQFQILSDKTLTNLQKIEKLRRQGRFTTLVYLAATVIVIFLGSILTYYALPKYVDSIPFLWVLSIAGLGKCIYFIYCNYLFYYNKTQILMYITFGTSLLHFALSFALTRFSLYYTSIVYAVVMWLMTLMVYIHTRKLITCNLECE